MVTVLGQLLVAMRSSRRPLKYTIAAVTWDNTLISQMRTVVEEETLVAQGLSVSSLCGPVRLRVLKQ